MAALSKQEVPPWGLAVAGSAAALVANALVYPLDMVKTRLQVQVKQKPGEESDGTTPSERHYTGTLHAVKSIIEDEGIAGLYGGITGSLLGVSSTNFAYFYWYSTVRSLYFSRVQKSDAALSTAVELSLGALAGALAQLFTIPIAVITTRQQTQPKGDKRGIFATGKEIVESEDGVSGLWRGLKASLVLVVNPAITYGAYERLRAVIYPGKTKLRPHEAFLLGAMSKILATIATQPLIVAKVGLQSRPPPSRKGKPFKSFLEVMEHIIEHEGPLGLFKGIAPQILKGFLVQGILMMSKEKIELTFVLLFRYMRKVRREQVAKLAEIAARKAEEVKVAAQS